MLVSKKSAVQIFYYLTAIDDEITDEELEQLDEIGFSLDGEKFLTYKTDLQKNCIKAVEEADGNELYDILSEYADEAFLVKEDDDAIPSRMLVWDMMVLAFADGEYVENEKRLVHHIARRCKIENSVVAEMEGYIDTIDDIDNELLELQNSSLPYSKINPIVLELNRRKDNILEAAFNLIQDEFVSWPDKLEVKEDIVDKARVAYEDKANPAKEKVLAESKKAASTLGKKASKAFEVGATLAIGAIKKVKSRKEK